VREAEEEAFREKLDLLERRGEIVRVRGHRSWCGLGGASWVPGTLAIVLGFVPAHFIAHSREASAYRDLDARLVSIQSNADTPEAWATLDKTRADFLDRKHEERRNIALMALAIWALVGGAIGYGWFKRVPWDEL